MSKLCEVIFSKAPLHGAAIRPRSRSHLLHLENYAHESPAAKLVREMA